MAFRSSDTELRAKFDAAITSMKCDGTLDAMIRKPEYFGAETPLAWDDAGKTGC
jgi:polar amino acid transport system substrate-binding protein